MKTTKVGSLGAALLLIFTCNPANADPTAVEVNKVVERAAQVVDQIVAYSNNQKALLENVQASPSSAAAFKKFKDFSFSDDKYFTSLDLKLKSFKNLFDHYSMESWDSLVARTPGNPNYEKLMNFYTSVSQWNSVRRNETKMLQRLEGKCWNQKTFTTFSACIRKIPKIQSTLDASNTRLQNASNKMTDSIKAF